MAVVFISLRRYASVFLFMVERTLTWVWLAGICLQIVLAVVLVVRRVWRKFPVFSLYFMVNLLLSSVLILLSATQALRPRVYFYSYWMCQELVLALGLGVVFEVFLRLLTPYPTIKRTVVPACFLAVALLAAFDAIVIYTHHSAGAISPMVPFLRAEEAVRVLQAGLVVFLCFCAGFFRLHLRQVEFGIALGMGVYAALQLIVVVMMAHFGLSGFFTTSLLGMLAFDIAVAIWLRYLVAERAPGGAGHWPDSRDRPGQ